MSEGLVNLGTGNVVEGLITGIIIGVFVLLLFVVLLILMRQGMFNKQVYIIRKTKIYKVKGAIAKSRTGDDVLKLASSPVHVIFLNWEVHLNRNFAADDVIYLFEAAPREYRYVRLEPSEELIKIVYNDNETLVKEKFQKNILYYTQLFNFESRFQQSLPVILLFGLLLFATIIIYDGINKTQLQVAQQISGSQQLLAQTITNVSNGTYYAQACKVYQQTQNYGYVPNIGSK